MRLIAGGASVTGPRHLELMEPNQDAMGLVGYRGGWLASVADGLGSRFRSDQGSRKACQVARRVMRTAKNCFVLPDAIQSTHGQWLEAIGSIPPEDAATTILFARVTANGEVHAAQLGDGLLLMRCGGEFSCVTPERAGFSNQTLALEAEHKQNNWIMTEGVLTRPGDGVVLMSDGVADDLDLDHLHEFFDTLYLTVRPFCCLPPRIAPPALDKLQ